MAGDAGFFSLAKIRGFAWKQLLDFHCGSSGIFITTAQGFSWQEMWGFTLQSSVGFMARDMDFFLATAPGFSWQLCDDFSFKSSEIFYCNSFFFSSSNNRSGVFVASAQGFHCSGVGVFVVVVVFFFYYRSLSFDCNTSVGLTCVFQQVHER